MADQTNTYSSDILRSAWKRFAELDAAASRMNNQHNNLRKWTAILGVVATLLAVFLEQISKIDPFPNFDLTVGGLRIILITLPITISVLAAYINKFLGSGEWLTLRAAAEEVLKEIYLYRTVLQWHPERSKWLAHRLTTVLRRVYRSMSGQLVLDSFKGQLPPYYNPDNEFSDPGFSDLSGSDYLKYRLIDQRNWHRNKIIQRQRERKRIQLTILAMGGMGALFAALGGGWIAWVAITAAIASALTGWEQLRGLDETIMIYSRLILELTVIRDDYESVSASERTRRHFVKMVRNAEGVMWAQNQKYVATMQEALAAADGDDAAMVEEMISMGNETMDTIETRMRAESMEAMEHTRDRVLETVDSAGNAVQDMVDTVADEAQAYTQMAGDAVEQVAAESEAYRESASDILSEAIEETTGLREDLEEAGQAMLDDAAAMAETVGAAAQTARTEMDAMRQMMEASSAQAPEDTTVSPEGTSPPPAPAAAEPAPAQDLPDADDIAQDIIDDALDGNSPLEEEIEDLAETAFLSGEPGSALEDALSGLFEGDGDDGDVKG